MKTSLKVQMVAAIAALAGASAMLATSGCELIADFDRSLIDAGDLDAPDDDVSSPSFDANFDVTPITVFDGGSDAGFDTGADAGPDAGGDAATDAADSASTTDASDSATDASDASDAAGQMDAADAPG